MKWRKYTCFYCILWRGALSPAYLFYKSVIVHASLIYRDDLLDH